MFTLTSNDNVSLIQFINGCRTKMTGLDQHNMNLIETSFKKTFRDLDEDGFTNV